jgi:hypothetical protein
MIAARAAARVGLALLVLGGPPPAAAETLTATYALSWAGLEVGELETVVAEQADGGYRVAWQGRTRGLVGALHPFTGWGRSEGRRDGRRFVSARYAGRSRWRDGGTAWLVAFGPDGRATRVEIPPEQLAEREPVPEPLRAAPDPAALALTAIAAAGPGARAAGTSFDGRRAVRFALGCAAAPSEEGELACTVEGRLLAGAARAGRARPGAAADRDPARVWLRADVHEGGGWWPVRIEVPARFGTVTARLVRAERRPHIGG